MKKIKFNIFSLLVATILFSFSYSTISANDNSKNNDDFTTESDFIREVSTDCYLVNVRVYAAVLGQRTLVANEDVLVGSGCSEEDKGLVNPNESSNCEKGHLPNGDYVFPNQNHSSRCLLDLLRENEGLYGSYLVSVNKTISDIRR